MLSDNYSSKEFRVAEKLFDYMETRSFNPTTFSFALLRMSGRCLLPLIQTVELFLSNLAHHASNVDMSDLDNDTLDAVNRALVIDQVLREARDSGRL